MREGEFVLSIHSRLLAAAGISFALVLAGCNSSKPVRPVASVSKDDKPLKIAPEFALKDADGKTVRLSDYKGKVVLLDFWATWCGPCKIEIPWFIEFERTYKDKGFAVIGIATDDEGWTVVKPFISELAINYRILKSESATEESYVKGGIEALPTTFLIGRDGKIAAEHVGLTGKDEFEDGIKRLLEGRGIVQERAWGGLTGGFAPAMLSGAK